MDYQSIHTKNGDLIVGGLRHFALADILESGQCFRWNKVAENRYHGVAHGRALTAAQDGDSLVLHGVGEEDFGRIWRDYFDLGRDYGAVKERLCAGDPAMGRAVAFTPGMRVLRQEPWETLCSFILSANNNIARIKGIVERLCVLLGEEVAEGVYAFPSPEAMTGLNTEDLAPLRCGYRARYLIDAARLVATGDLALEPLYTAPIDEARAALQRICGVGVKVAECALLYGFGRSECVPVDVWIGRALANFYPGGMPAGIAEIAGLGQQYLFHYVRNCPEVLQAV